MSGFQAYRFGTLNYLTLASSHAEPACGRYATADGGLRAISGSGTLSVIRSGNGASLIMCAVRS